VTFVFLIKKLDVKTPGREDIVEPVSETVASIVETMDDTALVIKGLGGADNIEHVTNCFTRLRVTVKDEMKVDDHILQKVSQQKGVVKNGKNIQVIIGMGVQTFKEEVCATLGITE
ncbi:PTS sugar transporter subunit IIC, partial [Streptococcus suis]